VDRNRKLGRRSEMARKRYTAEQIIGKLRQAEVLSAGASG
jgi:hypothetical protein